MACNYCYPNNIENTNKKTGLIGYMSNSIDELFELYMFQLYLNINRKCLGDVLLLSTVTHVTYVVKIADENLKDCILE